MHEEQARLLIEHVAVNRGDLDPIVTQSANYPIHFVGPKYEVTGDRGFTPAGRLKIDPRGYSHRGRNVHSPLADRLASRNAHLVHTAVALSSDAQRAGNSQGIDVCR